MDVKLVQLIFCCSLAIAVSGQSEKVCFPASRNGDVFSIAKLGGSCTCDLKDLNDMTDKLRALEEQVANLQSIITTPPSISPPKASKSPKIRRKLPPTERIDKCSAGMRVSAPNKLPDSAFTASSVFNKFHVASEGRLDNTQANGAWWPSTDSEGSLGVGEWLQIDLGKTVEIRGVVTQGSFQSSEWVSSYEIQYGNSPDLLQYYKEKRKPKLFEGNTDENSYVINTFKRKLKARYFRLIIKGFKYFPALRMDLLTC